MTVEITGYSFTTEKTLNIYANNVGDMKLMNLERTRDDGYTEELTFVFTKDEYKYLYSWLKRQKTVKNCNPKTLGDAVRATLGTITTISGKYLEVA